MVDIRRVSYAYNSLLKEPYFLDAYHQREGQVLVDVHGVYPTIEDFLSAIDGIVPMFKVEPEPPQEEEDDYRWLNPDLEEIARMGEETENDSQNQ